MSKSFEANLQRFGQKNAKASALLSFADPGTLAFAQDAVGDPILLDRTKNGDFFYHSPHSAKEEAGAWANALALQGVTIITIFGLGLGYAYFALKEWLERDETRQIIFLEDDLRVILRFLESPNAKVLLADPQVHLHYIEDSEEGLGVIQSIAWGTFGKNMQISALPFYEKNRKKVFQDVKTRLLYESSDIHLILDEYVGYGVSFFRNFWKNLFLMPGSYRGNKLQGAFRGIPAILVAAGPSLAQHLEQLKNLRDKALIFAGGSSINALLDANILPHFGAGIDPNPMQYLRFRQALAFQLPYFYRHRLLHESARMITGPRLYLKGGDGYNISEWAEKLMKIPGTILGGGHSIANFIIEIAYALGCNPIILVGYDLAYGKELERYAPGVEAGHQIGAKYEPYDEPVAWENLEGQKVQTAYKWLLEAKWIEDFVHERPRLKCINATEGGLGFKNIPHMTLAEVTDKYLNQARDLDSLVQTSIHDAGTIASSFDLLLKSCSKMYDSLERAKGNLEELIMIVTAGRKKSHPKACLEEPCAILLEAKLKKEIAYRYILEVFDRMRSKLEYYRLQFASHPTTKPKALAELELDLLLERLSFLKDTAIINQLLMSESIQSQQAKGVNIKAFSPKSKVLWA